MPTLAFKRRVPLVGDLWAFFTDRLAFAEACARVGDAVAVRLGPRRALVLSHPELVREVFIREAQHFVRGVTGAPMRSLLGEGLLLSEGEVWRRQRREVQPLLASGRIDSWIHVVAAAATALVSRWGDGEQRDMHHEMHRLTLDVAARIFLGIEGDEQGQLDPALETLLREDVFQVAIPLGPFRWPMRSSDAARALDDLILRQIEGAGSPGGSDFMAALAKTTRDRRELRDELITLLLTAQDTTAVGLTWFWFLLAQNEHAEERLRQQLDAPEDGPGRASLPYLTAAITETLRLFPPVIGEAREAIRECEIGGVHVRPGDLVMFSQWVIHRDRRWFDRPQEFLPERWLGELEERLHPFAYFPFGGGRRVCVGRALALTIAATVIPIIARRYRLVALSGHQPKLQTVITPRPRGGLPMQLRRLPE